MTAFWSTVVSLRLTDVSDMRTASIITLMMKAIRTSEISVYFDETIRRYTPESCHLHNYSREKMKSHIMLTFLFKHSSMRGSELGTNESIDLSVT
jgi:hypothetical protein